MPQGDGAGADECGMCTERLKLEANEIVHAEVFRVCHPPDNQTTKETKRRSIAGNVDNGFIFPIQIYGNLRGKRKSLLLLPPSNGECVARTSGSGHRTQNKTKKG